VSSSALALDFDDPPDAAPSARAQRKELASVYRAHHRFVWRSLVRLGVPDDRVSDGVHDVFMVVARRLHEFEGRSSIRTWLFAIAMRVAQSVRRDDAREIRRREKVGEATRESHDPHVRADAARTLRDLLAHLDDDKRAVFIMAELEGMTAPEIAGVLGIRVPTVYSRLRLARSSLERVVARHQARERRQP
jgi:RNA polymerase sigma-70 factor, ECF subfamily